MAADLYALSLLIIVVYQSAATSQRRLIVDSKFVIIRLKMMKLAKLSSYERIIVLQML